MMPHNSAMERYHRQIILPEIGIEGQKKLGDSTVFVQAQSVESCALLLFYLAAAGMGTLYCDFAEKQGLASLIRQIGAFNSGVKIQAVQPGCENLPGDTGVGVIQGSLQYVAQPAVDCSGKCIPLILAANRGWQGWLQFIKRPDDLRAILFKRGPQPPRGYNMPDDGTESVFSSNLLGALVAVEVVKILLSLENSAAYGLEFDLSTMRFERYKGSKACPASIAHPCITSGTPGLFPGLITTADTQQLAQSRVAVVGSGGLGSPALYTLAKAGVGTIALVDYDQVDISNLNRQILHSETRLGLPKVDSAEVFLRQLNPAVNLVKHNTCLTEENAREIISTFDLVVDCVDNLKTRYLVNEACALLNKPLVEAGVNGFEGIATTIMAAHSACYQCLFPARPSLDYNSKYGPQGILGPVAGVLGTIQGCEACKCLTKKGNPLLNSILAYDGMEAQFEIFRSEKDPNCPICAKR